METEITKIYNKIYKPKNIDLLKITKETDGNIYDESNTFIKTIKGHYIATFRNLNNNYLFSGNFYEGQNLEEAFNDLLVEHKII